MATAPAFLLDLELDPASGSILRLADREAGIDLLRCDPGPELALNDVPLRTRIVAVANSAAEHITTLGATIHGDYGTAVELRIRRIITCSGHAVHPGPRRNAHIRYEIKRVPAEAEGDGMDYIWQPRIEGPCQVQQFTVLAQPQRWLGAGTHMRNLAIGGSGPREHVSYEEGPIAEVVPWLQTAFRTSFPGQLTVNGAMYFTPGDGFPFVWLHCQRPHTGGRILFGERQHAYRFTFHTELKLGHTLFIPALSLAWGRGEAESDRVLADLFACFAEPPPWWYRTTWFWMHPHWQPGGDFFTMGRGMRILQEECGVNGFGLLVHEVPRSGSDIDVGSLAPDHHIGGDDALRAAVAGVRAKGGKTYIWFTRMGHRPDPQVRADSWAIRGVDGRPCSTTYRPSAGVTIDICDSADPGWQAYVLGWIEYYVKVIGVNGIFWDSGFQPIPPDFGAKEYLKYPGEACAAGIGFYDKAYRLGKSLDPDFFMWTEGINVDCAANAFAVDNKQHGPRTAHMLMNRLAHAGRKRLTWRSAWPHELASGFAWLNPVNDVNWPPGEERYRQVAADPMNRWICRTVAERGIKHAVGLADGISLLDEFVVACPKVAGRVLVPAARARGESLVHVVSGARLAGVRSGEGVCFDLPESGAWRMA